MGKVLPIKQAKQEMRRRYSIWLDKCRRLVCQRLFVVCLLSPWASHFARALSAKTAESLTTGAWAKEIGHDGAPAPIDWVLLLLPTTKSSTIANCVWRQLHLCCRPFY